MDDIRFVEAKICGERIYYNEHSINNIYPNLIVNHWYLGIEMAWAVLPSTKNHFFIYYITDKSFYFMEKSIKMFNSQSVNYMP